MNLKFKNFVMILNLKSNFKLKKGKKMRKIEKNFCAFCLARNYAFIMLIAFFACFLGACSSESEFDAMGMFEPMR